MHFPCANHLGERNTKFGRAHGAGHRQEHLSAFVQVRNVSIACVDQRCRVKVPVMMPDEAGNRTLTHLSIRYYCSGNLINQAVMERKPMPHSAPPTTPRIGRSSDGSTRAAKHLLR